MHKFKYSVIKTGKKCIEPVGGCGKFHKNTPFNLVEPIIHKWYQNSKRKISKYFQKLQKDYNKPKAAAAQFSGKRPG